MCDKCGTALEIIMDGQHVSQGYSPFTAKRYVIRTPTDKLISQDSAEKSKESKPVE